MASSASPANALGEAPSSSRLSRSSDLSDQFDPVSHKSATLGFLECPFNSNIDNFALKRIKFEKF